MIGVWLVSRHFHRYTYLRTSDLAFQERVHWIRGKSEKGAGTTAWVAGMQRLRDIFWGRCNSFVHVAVGCAEPQDNKLAPLSHAEAMPKQKQKSNKNTHPLTRSVCMQDTGFSKQHICPSPQFYSTLSPASEDLLVQKCCRCGTSTFVASAARRGRCFPPIDGPAELCHFFASCVCVAVACSLHSLHSLLTTTPHTHCLAHSLTACADRGVHRDRIGCTAR